MSTQVFPSLPGLAWPVTRTTEFRTRKQTSLAGQETAIADMPFPRYTWKVVHNVLRQGSNLYKAGDTFTEWATLFGFYNARNGGADSFLYTDPDDSQATTQSIGVGDASTTVFQLVRSIGGFTEPVWAPNAVAAVRLNGTVQGGGTYTITLWETGNANGPGNIIFNSPPGAGVVITADFTYYWPVRFVDDQCEFEKMLANRWAVKSLSFKSVLL